MNSAVRICTLIIISILLNSVLLRAQISISDNDIISLKGTSRSILISVQDTNATEISLGTGGTNQVWDYRNVDASGLMNAKLEFLDPAGGLKADLFPTSNLRQGTSVMFNGVNYVLDNYFSVTSNQFKTLGTATNFSGGNETVKFQEDAAPLPMTMGTNWQSTSMDTSEIAGIITITKDSSWNIVDASGTLRLPIGNFDCLRVREYSVFISSTMVFGFSFEDTTETISYTWLTKDHLQTLSADSSDNGMGKINQMVSEEAATSITDLNEIPSIFLLEQNYPNPFNPTTTIKYDLPKQSYITLKVYNILGQEVATLVNAVRQAGSYSIVFSASSLPSGVYVYTLATDEFISTKKMIVIK